MDSKVRVQPRYAGLTSWILNTVEGLRLQPQPPMGIGTTFDPRKMIIETVFLIIAFWGTAWPAVAAIVAIGFATLRLRDLHIHPAAGSVGETATDALVLAVSIVFSQAYFSVTNPFLATKTASEMAHGTAIAMMLIAAWRLWFHLHTPKNDSGQEPEFRVFRSALRLNVMYGFAKWLLMGSSLIAVPGGHLRDSVASATSVLTIALVYRLRRDTDRSAIWVAYETYTIFKDPVIEDLKTKTHALPGLPSKPSFGTRQAFCFQILCVVSMILPFAIAFWRLLTGQSASVHWGQLGANALALSILIPLWRVISQFNQATSGVLQNSVQTRLRQNGSDSASKNNFDTGVRF